MSGFLNNSFRVYPVKLKIGMLYYTNNTFRDTVLEISLNVSLTWMNCNWTGILQITEAATRSLLWEKEKFAGKHPCQGLQEHFFKERAPPSDCFLSNTTSRLYFLKEIVLAHFQSLFGRSNRHLLWENDVFWENEGKMDDGVCVKEFFFVNLQFAEAAAGAVL